MVDIYVDGSFLPGTCYGSYGMVILGENCIRKTGGRMGVVRDSNVAEYFAIFRGLQELKRLGLSGKAVKIHTDSKVILQQLKKELPPPGLDDYNYWYREILFSLTNFSKCTIDFIRSKKNPAHNVAREAMTFKEIPLLRGT